jgi:DNA adenine methylase
MTEARPFLQWAGGKHQLLARFEPLWPRGIGRYVEPFLGSGAVFFHLAGRAGSAWLNDRNPMLVELFRTVRNDVDTLIDELENLAGRGCNTKSVFHRRREEYNSLLEAGPSVRRCALFIYLNRTCYNGLYRVNRQGRFNVPFGRYRKPAIVQPDRLRSASRALARARRIDCQDFERFLLSRCREGDLVYLDPPYVPVSATSSFTSYTSGAFGTPEQERLASTLLVLHERGVRWMLSNSFTPVSRRIFVTRLLRECGLPRRRPHVAKLPARRAINSRADARGPVYEYVVRNYRD